MSDSHFFSSELIKACDMRGIVGEDLHDEDSYFVGRSFGTSISRNGKTSCVVGRDGRLSSSKLTEGVINGLRDSGIDVIDIGVVPTPVVYFGLSHLKAQSGLIVTASHNPAEYNGFKFLTDDGPFHGQSIKDLSILCEKSDFESGEGTLKYENIISEYIKYLIAFLVLPYTKDLSVVWDPGNGATGAVLGPFLEHLPGYHTVICGEVDGTFPNHHPDPSLEKNVEMLKLKIKETGADFGIAFDGDGDRIGIVDAEGYLFKGDQLLIIFSRDYLKKNPSEVVMSEVNAGKFFYDDVAANGGIPLMWKVGHTNQKEKMEQEKIGLAGETSGHFFFGENNGYDDALFAAVKLLNILASSNKSITDMRKAFPVYHKSDEIRISMGTAERQRVLSEVSRRLTDAGRKYIGIDGIRISCSDGFWMMRSSNTQPHLSIRCESLSREGLEDCLNELRDQLTLSGISMK